DSFSVIDILLFLLWRFIRPFFMLPDGFTTPQNPTIDRLEELSAEPDLVFPAFAEDGDLSKDKACELLTDTFHLRFFLPGCPSFLWLHRCQPRKNVRLRTFAKLFKNSGNYRPEVRKNLQDKVKRPSRKTSALQLEAAEAVGSAGW